MKILVAGGAGYIGAHMCKYLAEFGHEPVVLDNFSTGHRGAIRWGKVIECSLAHRDQLHGIFEATKFDAVMVFAASSIVGESVTDPLAYYRNNVASMLTLLEVMLAHGVKRIVFSSSAAVYGEPQAGLITEAHPTHPVNPYGRSKRMVEQILEDAAKAHGLHAVSLRYFNAAGAAEDAKIGEAHQPETHLIPRLLQFALGQDNGVRIYGDDYPTLDGTCVRDFIHVMDLCSAHLKALQYLDRSTGFQAFNLGNGVGHSVLQVVNAVQDVVGRKLTIETVGRRVGDPSMLVASSELARDVLGWQPEANDIRLMIESAWRWHRNPAY